MKGRDALDAWKENGYNTGGYARGIIGRQRLCGEL